MAANRNRIILDEADNWRRDGRIDDAFHAWIRSQYPVQGDAGTQRTLQRILVAVAGILVLVGIFTLVAEFWSAFGRGAKFGILVGFAGAAIALGLVLGRFASTRLLGHGILPLCLPLYLFATQYVGDPPDIAVNTLNGAEIAASAVGILAGLAALLVGLWRYPGLALSAAPTVCFCIVFLEGFGAYSLAVHKLVLWATLGTVALFHAFYFLLWSGAFRLGFAWAPFAARIGWAANVPFGFFAAVELVGTYADPGRYPAPPLYDQTWVGVPVSAAYAGILLATALRFGLPELTIVCGVFLVGDAIWLGVDKGGVLGAVIAIFATAAAFALLAQQGVLKRIFRPRPPPGASSN